MTVELVYYNGPCFRGNSVNEGHVPRSQITLPMNFVPEFSRKLPINNDLYRPKQLLKVQV